MLRANTREEIVNVDFEKLCFEWKERAPIFCLSNDVLQLLETRLLQNGFLA